MFRQEGGTGDTMKRMEEITIGERLRRLRERVQMSQAELSEASGIGAAMISRYERSIMTPGWLQVEKILLACDATPCDLFEDYCLKMKDEETTTFEVEYWERRPDTPDEPPPTARIRFRKNSPLVSMLGIAAADNRYAIVQAVSDSMIPDIYPGDLMLSDRKAGPALNRVVAGYLDGYPMVARLTSHQRKKYLVPSNRNYSAAEFAPDKWDHRGVIIHSIRDLTVRYHGGEFVDESSDVVSLQELRRRRGGGNLG